ncbi:MAG: right-handed parallel beta-helix repeat-containing protein, partial [Thermoplasmatales archaeon]|nr:right-handed parallel beta-helix repeat-containing protein [Thermoplasmatales archaeon]
MRKMRKLVIMVCIAAMIMTNIPNWDAGADVSGTPWSETGDTLIGNACKDYPAHIPILITNNSDFETQAASEEWEGDGTAANPYIIQNYDINANTTHGIHIENTDVYFVIRDCRIHDGKSNENFGIFLCSVENGTIDNATSYDNKNGICLNSSNNNSITNCFVYNNSHNGILLYSSSNNNITNCSVYNNSGDGICLWYYSNNNGITNCSFYNNFDGVWSDYSNNNNITNCAVYNNSDYGIWLFYYSNNNSIADCSVHNNNVDGVVLDTSSNNLVSNCTISSNTNAGIYIEDSSNNEVIGSTISDNNAGIYTLHSTNTSVEDCNFSNNTYGTVVDSSSDTTMAECDYTSNGNMVYSRDWDRASINVTVLSPAGITCWNSSETKIMHCILSENKKGICLQNSSNTNISNTVISSNNETGIYLYNSSDNLIVNSNISGNYSNSDYHDLFLSSDSHLYLLNTTFTNVSFADNVSTLNVSWYLNVNVTWKNNISAEYANVRIQDNENGTFDENYTTDKTGWIKDIVIQEYTQNQTDNTSFTPHNVTAWQGDISNLTNVTVNRTQDFQIILDHNAPEINDTTISPEQEYTIDENTTVEFSF